MKKPNPEPLPIQELLQTQQLAVLPLQDFASELSAVPHRHNAYQLIYVQETKGGDNLIDFRRYEMLAGRPPFAGESVLATLERVRGIEEFRALGANTFQVFYWSKKKGVLHITA